MRIVAGTAKGRLLKSPPGRKSRPTSSKVKSAFFNIISYYINDASFLDLFSGTGNVGIEALSRGAGRVVFVEKDSYLVKLLRQNLSILGMQEFAEVLSCNVYKALKTLGEKKELFSIIYIDPPYRYRGIGQILEFLSKENLVTIGGIIAVERDRRSEESETWLKNAPFQLWQKKNLWGYSFASFKEPVIIVKKGFNL